MGGRRQAERESRRGRCSQLALPLQTRTRSGRGEDPRDILKANSTAGSGAGPRQHQVRHSVGLRVQGCPREGAVGSNVFKNFSQDIVENLLPLPPT